LIDALFARGELAHYPLAHSARADLCRRLGMSADAAVSYRKALELARQEPERRFIQWRLAELSEPAQRALGARVIPNVRTQRLVLVAATLEHIVAELKDPGRLGPLLGARVTEGWPPGEYDRAAMMSFRSRLREDPPRYAGWLSWYVMTAEAAGTQPTLVAAAGFMGPPENGAVEIGYSVIPEARSLGYATEIVEALTRRAFEVEAVHRVVAETDASNASSQRVLERNGFVRVGAGRETTSVRYEKTRSSLKTNGGGS
jgi:RimJ/RimL family protein N-acetyltransferase